MTEVFLLKNQHGNFLEKSGEWVNPTQSKSLYRTLHRDEAINQKVELAVKNADLRVEITTGQVGPEGKLVLQHCDIPLEMPAADLAAQAEEALNLERELSEEAAKSESEIETNPAGPSLFDQEAINDTAPTSADTVSEGTQAAADEESSETEQPSLFSA